MEKNMMKLKRILWESYLNKNIDHSDLAFGLIDTLEDMNDIETLDWKREFSKYFKSHNIDPNSNDADEIYTIALEYVKSHNT